MLFIISYSFNNPTPTAANIAAPEAVDSIISGYINLFYVISAYNYINSLFFVNPPSI